MKPAATRTPTFIVQSLRSAEKPPCISHTAHWAKGRAAHACRATQGECSTTEPRCALNAASSSERRPEIVKGVVGVEGILERSLSSLCVAVHRII